MKYCKLIAALLLSICSSASFGLADASAPTKIQIPFGNGAGGSYIRTIPVASQIGIQNGAASYTDGFPPLNFVPVNAGGVPPFGQDMNGILRDVSAHARWWAVGGPVYYDGTYQTAIGGYPKGACVQSTVTTAMMWCSTIDNNVTNPDTGGAGWVNPVLGSATATTQASTDNSTKIATTAFVKSSTFGSGQTRQNVTGSRSFGVVYTNTTNRPIDVSVVASLTGSVNPAVAQNIIALYAGGVVVSEYSNPTTVSMINVSVSAIVLPGETYEVINNGTLIGWFEIR